LEYNSSDIHVQAYSTGVTGSGNGDFQRPIGVAVSGGTVFVVDQGNHRVQTFNQGTGAYISQFGSANLTGPEGMALGSNGTLYVADSQADRIVEFDTSGNHLGSFGSAGVGNGEFLHPYGVASACGGPRRGAWSLWPRSAPPRALPP
jgi:DNA-binding beta-propeller fold protein YncE